MLSAYRFAIIEDNLNFAKLVDWTLNAEVKFFKEVSQFKDDGFDLVFLDLRLGETWGIDTIIALKKITSIPIIVLTGLGGAYLAGSDYKAYLEAGAVEVYDKQIVNDAAWPGMLQKILKDHGK
jgi:DNA-binding response OmpR family regulator